MVKLVECRWKRDLLLRMLLAIINVISYFLTLYREYIEICREYVEI